MSDESRRPIFRLLPGGSDTASPSREVELKVLPRRAPPRVQLGFPFVRSSNKALISVGYNGLTQQILERLLAEHMPTSFVDIRISPSFNNHVLKRDAVSQALKSSGVRYFHFPELANRFVGDALGFRWSLEKYAASLEDNAHLVRIHELIEQGPIVLLSGPSDHASSERAILVEELKRRWPAFEVVVYP